MTIVANTFAYVIGADTHPATLTLIDELAVDQRQGGARSDRHNRPGVSRPGPNQAVTVGPNQSVISIPVLTSTGVS